MKKTKRILMTVTLLIAAVFLLNSANLPAGTVQAASKGTYRAILQAYRKNDYRKVQRLSKKLPKKANEKCARKLNAKYRKAAKKVTGKMRKWRGMENYIPGIQWYVFSDINKNGKPELIVKYGGVETDCSIWVYEYKGGKYKKANGAIYDTWLTTLLSENDIFLSENRERLCRVRLKHIHHKEKARKNNETNKTNHHDPYPVNCSSIFYELSEPSGRKCTGSFHIFHEESL